METVRKKICATCKIEKEINEFIKDKTEKDGYTYSCKICRREKQRIWRANNPDKIRQINLKREAKRKAFYKTDRGVEISRRAHLKRMFGITLEHYNEILEKQNGVCSICGMPETGNRNSFLSVDHCHDSNEIRGLLCNTCNRGLGLMKDDINVLEKAIEYLKQFKNR